MVETVLITGASGMIGVRVVKRLIEDGNVVIGIDRVKSSLDNEKYTHIILDLNDVCGLQQLFGSYKIGRVVHLAALAHTVGRKSASYDDYYMANVICSNNIFDIASKNNVPVLLISTVDVYGFVKGVVNSKTEPHPITSYGKTKYMAEQNLKQKCSHYDIFRFAPVYSDEQKRDIQKRYYLHYPNWAYIIGGGLHYEFLCIDTAAKRIAEWCKTSVSNRVFIVKDNTMTSTSQCLQIERSQGRAKHVLFFPKWLVRFGFGVIYCLTGKNRYTFLLNKAVNPLRTE